MPTKDIKRVDKALVGWIGYPAAGYAAPAKGDKVMLSGAADYEVQAITGPTVRPVGTVIAINTGVGPNGGDTLTIETHAARIIEATANGAVAAGEETAFSSESQVESAGANPPTGIALTAALDTETVRVLEICC